MLRVLAFVCSVEDGESTGTQTVAGDCNPTLAFVRSLNVATQRGGFRCLLGIPGRFHQNLTAHWTIGGLA